MDETTPLDVESLVAQLTVEEKASLCLGSDFWHTAAVPRLSIPAVMLSDGPHGLRKQADAADHVGLSGSVPATCFPTGAALASSWDADLVRTVGVALGREARALGVSVVLGPGINIKRSPLCGRNFEYLSEDPHLAGVLGAAMVEGLQSAGVGASVKHYAVNNQETDRLRVSADVDERTLREIYLPAFEHVVKKAQPWTVMCAYNKVNGTYASQHHWLLTQVLRDEWGFAGVVISDWGAVADRPAALAAGLDLEMPPNLGVSDVAIVEAVRTGALGVDHLNGSARRMVELAVRAQPALADPGAIDAEAQHRVARLAATESAVLLKNEDSLLPLDIGPGDTLAVIGEFARSPRFQGAGSSQVSPTRVDTALDALADALPMGAALTFAPGFTLDTADVDDALLREAVEAARRATTAVVFLGLPASVESEGFDRSDIRLPSNQLTLVHAIAAANPRVVVVLSNGSAVQLAGWEHEARAVLECWLTGQAGGGAVASLLVGTAEPCGRLAETLPTRIEDNSSYLNFPGEAGHVRYGEGVFVGYRGYDAAALEVSYPFGHGLGYTTFEYADLSLSVTGSIVAGDLCVEVSCVVTNTGSRFGKTVVQVYVSDPESAVARPPRELRAFSKIGLDAGQSSSVSLQLDSRAFAYWSVLHSGWLVEGGDFQIAVGRSSRDLPLSATVTIDAPDWRPPLSLGSTLDEWLLDPEAARALGAGQDGGSFVNDRELVKVIGNFPMDRLVGFPGFGLSRAELELFVRERSRRNPPSL